MEQNFQCESPSIVQTCWVRRLAAQYQTEDFGGELSVAQTKSIASIFASCFIYLQEILHTEISLT